jgi:DHA3 family macrolide efflux protein-like MFS transporter
MQASTSLMVPEKHLSRIAGLNQALFGAMQIIAPPLGALLLGVLPMQFILSIDVFTAALAIGPLFFIMIPQPEREAAAEGVGATSVLTDMVDGFRFVWGWPGLFIIIVMAALINLLSTPAVSLLPILITDHFGGGAVQFATLESAFGLGMIGGGLLLSTWGGFKKRIVTAALALILLGIGIGVLGLTPAHLFGLAIAAYILAGIANPIANGSLFATLQTVVPPDKQGRVFTLVLSGASAMSPIGLAIAGPLSDAIGVQVWFLIAGVTVIIMGIAMFLIPAVYQLEERFAEAADAAEVPAEAAADDLLADGVAAR